MASYYVYSGAVGAANGTSWADAYTSMAVAVIGKAAGDRFYVAHDHVWSQATAMTITFPGTPAAPNIVLCVNRAGTVPPVSADLRTTATESTTAANAIIINGSANIDGVSITAGSTASTANLRFGTVDITMIQRWSNCTLALGGTSASSLIRLNAVLSEVGSLMVWNNVKLSFGAVGQGVNCYCSLFWSNTASAIQGTAPTTLFSNAQYINAFAEIRGVDLSAMGSGKNLVDVGQRTNAQFWFIDCKLGASVSATTGTIPGQGGTHVWLVNCDSADTQSRYYSQHYQGVVTHETTIIRTGGASDGTTGFSRKFVTTANAHSSAPHEGPWCKFWNNTLGATTVAIEIVTDNVTLTDAEAWIEVEYQGTSGFPLGTFTTDRAADILATPANQTTSTETWTTTGLTTPIKQVCSVSVTPAKIGWVYARLVVAKASTTVYACPKIKASTTQYMESDGSIVNSSANSSSGGSRGILTGGRL